MKIILADDHTLLRQSWALILDDQPEHSVVGQTNDGEKAIVLARDLKPDLVIMDINIPGCNGFDATERIIKELPQTKVLAVSMHTNPSYALKMLEKGASGYVTKNSPKEEMIAAIQEISMGKRYICNEIKEIMLNQALDGNQSVKAANLLSSREVEITILIKEGKSSKEIAGILSVSEKTVHNHRRSILKKLKLPNSPALVNFLNNHPGFFK